MTAIAVMATLSTGLSAQTAPDEAQVRLSAAEQERVALAERLVSEFNEALLALMKQDIDYDARIAAVKPLVAERFDFDFIGRASLGSRWRRLDGDEKALFRDTLLNLSASTYAARFDGYSGQSFALDGTDALRRKVVRVRTRMLRPGKEALRLDYLLRDQGDGLKLFNVSANGASELATRRTRYRDLFDADGLAGVLAAIEADAAAQTPGLDEQDVN